MVDGSIVPGNTEVRSDSAVTSGYDFKSRIRAEDEKYLTGDLPGTMVRRAMDAVLKGGGESIGQQYANLQVDLGIGGIEFLPMDTFMSSAVTMDMRTIDGAILFLLSDGGQMTYPVVGIQEGMSPADVLKFVNDLILDHDDERLKAVAYNQTREQQIAVQEAKKGRFLGLKQYINGLKTKFMK